MNDMKLKTYPLEEYIKANFDSKSDFADYAGVHKQQITKWINKGFIVVVDEDNVAELYSFRRDL